MGAAGHGSAYSPPPPADIFASQRNGPYTLTNVLLTDESGATLVTQQAQAVYTTAPYLYTDFAPNRIYLPLILR